jgi:thiamine pyrophosphate-dependent acetolactate synthase large subunit-like protein
MQTRSSSLAATFPIRNSSQRTRRSSAKQNQLPVKVVVFNNGALVFVELEMKAAGYVNFGTDLDDPDFSQLAT